MDILTNLLYFGRSARRNRTREPYRIAETGTYRGQTPERLLDSIRDLVVVTVDPYETCLAPFLPAPDCPKYDEDSRAQEKAMVQLTEDRAAADAALAPFGARAVQLRMTSSAAADLVADRSFDLVFVDGGRRDAEAALWVDKVRSGGILSGHDFHYGRTYEFPGIARLVRRCGVNATLFITFDWVWWIHLPGSRKPRCNRSVSR